MFALSLALGALGGAIFFKMKIPGGFMVGSLVLVTSFSLSTDMVSCPLAVKTIAQICSGAYIASGVGKNELPHLRHLAKPALILVCGLIATNILWGGIFYLTSGLDKATAFMCAVPGGISDTPIIAVDMGANGAVVTVAQFCRMAVGIGVFPTLINMLSKNAADEAIDQPQALRQNRRSGALSALTLAIGAAGGILGYLSGIPAGALLFSMLAVLIFNLLSAKAYMIIWQRRVAQVLSGVYIGSHLTMTDLYQVKTSIPALLLLLACYVVSCLLIGYIIHKTCKMGLRSSLLAATPAGAADMALIAAEMHASAMDVVVLQLIRLIFVLALCPQLVHFIITALP